MIGDIASYAGLRIVADASMTQEDWSGVRSPARARRRRAKHPQRIVVSPSNEAIVSDFNRTARMHPAMYDALKREIAERQKRIERDVFFGGGRSFNKSALMCQWPAT